MHNDTLIPGERVMPRYDIVVFGATSFVGRLVCRHLLERHGAQGELRWAMAARSRERLEAVRADLGPDAAAVPLVMADSGDEVSLGAMVGATRVVLSTVGPYAHYGSLLVRLCAEQGVDYCDLTGEVPWMARMLAAHGDTAARSGARIVHCAGFDSVPSDVGVHVLQREAATRLGAPCTRVGMRLKAASGTFSGGTVASLLNVLREARADDETRALLADPYALCAREGRPSTEQPEVGLMARDALSGGWIAPFIMGAINTRVVHRSHALRAHAWGADFRYDEAVMTGGGVRGWMGAAGMGAGLGGFMAALSVPPTRWLLERFVLPAPGEGPSPAAQERGFFDIRLFGRTADGASLQLRVTGDRDPGYGSTCKMIGEVAVALADGIGEQPGGGFFTPSVALGDALVERLEAHAGMTFEVID